MFRFSFRRFAIPTPVRVRQYVDHLYPRDGKELLPMTDIMPAANDGMSAAIEFQRMFLETISPIAAAAASAAASANLNNNNSSTTPTPRPSSSKSNLSVAPAAWICTLPGDGLLRNMGHHDTIVSPLPADMVSELPVVVGNNTNPNSSSMTFSKKKRRLQSIEMVLAVRVDEHTLSSPNPVISQVAPAILLRGSRYPFYAPHFPGFAADLSSAAQFVIGVGPNNNNSNNSNANNNCGVEYSSLNFNLEGMGAVLTLGVEPVAVGYIQRFHLADTIATAAEYIRVNFENDKNFLREKCGNGTGKENWWFATGCLARVPAAVGKYRANFGLLGDVRITITE